MFFDWKTAMTFAWNYSGSTVRKDGDVWRVSVPNVRSINGNVGDLPVTVIATDGSRLRYAASSSSGNRWVVNREAKCSDNEIAAITLGLDLVTDQDPVVCICTDQLYLVDRFYSPESADLPEEIQDRLDHLLDKGVSVFFRYVKSHAGVHNLGQVLHNECDLLCQYEKTNYRRFTGLMSQRFLTSASNSYYRKYR